MQSFGMGLRTLKRFVPVRLDRLFGSVFSCPLLLLVPGDPESVSS